jgi:hypothetical protein
MLPEVGASRPVSILMVVDLPAPFGPRKPKNWPGATLRLTFSTAIKSPKRRVSPEVEIAATIASLSILQRRIDGGAESIRMRRRKFIAAPPLPPRNIECF